MNTQSSTELLPELLIEMSDDDLFLLYPLLQEGFIVQAEVNIPVITFLTEQLELSNELVNTQIQTIFLNSAPVDDLEATLVQDGSVLALSAAMPGLVGAVMRRGGTYSSLRQSISYKQENACNEKQNGTVVVKLFNLLVREVGTFFLKQGITATGKQLHSTLLSIQTKSPEALRSVSINGRAVDVSTYELGIPQTDMHIVLRVQTPV